MDLSHLPITHRAVIPEDYLDAMGHMNVMWYTHLFSQGIHEIFRLVGLTHDYFRESNAGSFALKQFFNYRAEVRLGESVTIRSRMVARSEKRMHFIQFMVKDAGDVLAATGESVSAHIDMRIRHTSPYPPHIAAAIDEMVAEHAALGWDPPLCGAIEA